MTSGISIQITKQIGPIQVKTISQGAWQFDDKEMMMKLSLALNMLAFVRIILNTKLDAESLKTL
ncbi:MAG: hypothetical protein ACP5PT_00405 [Brevinematia bacterium]